MSETTQRETEFILCWKRVFGRTPYDWRDDQRDCPTSSWQNWRTWVNTPEISITGVEQVIAQFAGEKDLPSFHSVRSLYNRGQRRVIGYSQHSSYLLCSRCYGDGVVFVSVAGRPGHVKFLPESRPLLDGEEVYQISMPCNCSAGMRVNSKKWQVTPRVIAYAVAHRVKNSEYCRIRRECHELSGRPVSAQIELDPDIAGIMDRILSRNTSIGVENVTNTEPLRPASPPAPQWWSSERSEVIPLPAEDAF